MPKSKYIDVRVKVIDRCLSDRNHQFTMVDIFDLCNRELEERDYPQVTSMNTIRTDIEHIQRDHSGADVEAVRSGRNIYYRYYNPDFSIYKSMLYPEETVQLVQTLSLLKRFKGMPQFDWISEISDRLGTTLKIDEVPTDEVVGFDENIDLVGIEHFTPLFNAIIGRKSLLLNYKSFNTKIEQKISISPYYLKQYNKRWFLIAWNADLNFLANFALDRILGIEDSTVPFQSTDINFIDYFDEMIGVSKDTRTNPQHIKLWVSPSTCPYVKTKPFHGTQKTIDEDDMGAIVSIEVYPNYELEQLLLSYGENVKVIEPEELKIRIQERLNRAISNYEV
ncbi:MAG: WYL domain-containing protein [Bacteroidales bacterium]|nr:WYL domain-containing protein [Bacteroidales bacterium]